MDTNGGNGADGDGRVKKIANDKLKLLLITANVGTIFENLNELLEPWLNEFSKKLSQMKPDFVALHMQEIGGKNYRESMQLISPFFKKFLSDPVIKTFNRYLIIVDSDFTDDMSFTSLCNIYLISESLPENEIQLFNFTDKCYTNYATRQIFTGNLNNNEFIYKERFVRNFFTDFQWSRKGFIQTKWRIRNQNYDFVNIHLFHDPSNLIALNSSPSIYSENRKKALEYTIDKITHNHTTQDESLVFSIFGDFNFRLDLATLLNDFSNKSDQVQIKDKNNKLSRIVYKTHQDEDLFVIEDKKFKWQSDSTIQSIKNKLLKYDIELSLCNGGLYELEKNFPPSYPFSEELNHPDKYMESRCPSWCDRILLNTHFRRIVDDFSTDTDYAMMGEDTCMGDHKPIYLSFSVNSTQLSQALEEKNNNNLQPVINNNTNKAQQHVSTTSGGGSSANSATPLNSMLNVCLKYTYVNNSLTNLEKPNTDIHDNACFKNIHLLKHLIGYSAYARYCINNLKQPLASSSSSSAPLLTTSLSSSCLADSSNNKPCPCVHNNTAGNTNDYLVLNNWLKSIIELLLIINKLDNLKSCFLNNSPSTATTTTTATGNKITDCNCILNLIDKKHLFKSSFIKFFINSLNGNFFKLKHLNSFLNDTILTLNNELENRNQSDSGAPCPTPNQTFSSLVDCGDDVVNGPFDHSARTLIILNEINRFLTLPCAYSMFKQAILEHKANNCLNMKNNNSNLIASTFLNTADCILYSKYITNGISTNLNNNNAGTNTNATTIGNSTNSNNNNNDENFSNMNESSSSSSELKNVQLKLISKNSSLNGVDEIMS